MDSTRRTILATGAAVTAMAVAPRALAQQTGQEGTGARFYERGSVRIRYQEAGSGFPLLLIAGGGLNSRMAGLATSPFNPIEIVFTVTRDFVRNCQKPVLIMADDIPAHPYAVAMECAMLAPKAEVSIYPWKEPKERIPLAVRQVRSFLRAHQQA